MTAGKKLFFLVYLLALVAPVSLQAKSLEDVLAGALAPHVKEIPAGTKFYHHRRLDSSDERSETFVGRKTMAHEIIDSYANLFWMDGVLDNGAMTVGPGLYLALEPHSALDSFGDHIIQVELKRPVRYLDLKNNIAFRKDDLVQTPEYLAAVAGKDVRAFSSFSSPGPNDPYFGSWSLFSLIHETGTKSGVHLQNIVRLVFERLGITAYSYIWSEGERAIEQICEKPWGNAFFSALVYIGRGQSSADIDALYLRPNLPNATLEEMAARTEITKKQIAIGAHLEAIRNSREISPRSEELHLLRQSIFGCLE